MRSRASKALGVRKVTNRARIPSSAAITDNLARAGASPGCGWRPRDVGGALQTAPPLAQLGEAQARVARGAHAQVSGARAGS